MNQDVTSFEKDVVSLRGAALDLRSSLAGSKVQPGWIYRSYLDLTEMWLERAEARARPSPGREDTSGRRWTPQEGEY